MDLSLIALNKFLFLIAYMFLILVPSGILVRKIYKFWPFGIDNFGSEAKRNIDWKGLLDLTLARGLYVVFVTLWVLTLGFLGIFPVGN